VRRIAASLWFALRSAGQNFRRNLGVSLAGVFTMGLILFLVGGALLFTHSVNDVLQRQQANASHLRIYLSDSASLASIADFQSRLQHDPRVLSVTFENKDQAAREASQNPDIQSALTVTRCRRPSISTSSGSPTWPPSTTWPKQHRSPTRQPPPTTTRTSSASSTP
jgi:hypothetical protein